MNFLSKGFKNSSEIPEGRHGKDVINKLLKSTWVDKDDKETIKEFIRENPYGEIDVSHVPHPRLGYLGMESTQAYFYPNPMTGNYSFQMFWEI